jgi:hypothetical protein
VANRFIPRSVFPFRRQPLAVSAFAARCWASARLGDGVGLDPAVRGRCRKSGSPTTRCKSFEAVPSPPPVEHDPDHPVLIHATVSVDMP